MYLGLATTYFCCVVFFVLVQTASGDPGSAVFFCRLLSLKFAFLSLNDLLDCPGILINLWSQNRYGQELYVYYSFLTIDQQLSKETLDVVLIPCILGVHYEYAKKKRQNPVKCVSDQTCDPGSLNVCALRTIFAKSSSSSSRLLYSPSWIFIAIVFRSIGSLIKV